MLDSIPSTHTHTQTDYIWTLVFSNFVFTLESVLATVMLINRTSSAHKNDQEITLSEHLNLDESQLVWLVCSSSEVNYQNSEEALQKGEEMFATSTFAEYVIGTPGR